MHQQPQEILGAGLGWGIFFLPWIFTWFTLRKGHSFISRLLAFSWLAFNIFWISAISSPLIEGMVTYNKMLDTTLEMQQAQTATIAENLASSVVETKAKSNKVMKVKISNMLSAYTNNEVGADSKYKGKRVQVSGLVDSIKKDFLGNLYVTVGTGKTFEIPQIQAFFDDSMTKKLGSLKKGQKITVQCRIDGLMMNVIAKNCVIK